MRVVTQECTGKDLVPMGNGWYQFDRYVDYRRPYFATVTVPVEYPRHHPHPVFAEGKTSYKYGSRGGCRSTCERWINNSCDCNCHERRDDCNHELECGCDHEWNHEPTIGPVLFTPGGYPVNCVNLFRTGNIVTFSINTGLIVAPAGVTSNKLPRGFRPEVDQEIIEGVAGGVASHMIIDVSGTLQGSIDAPAPAIATASWVTREPFPFRHGPERDDR